MKSISAAIVVAAAAVLLLGGSFIEHDDTALFVQAAGCILGTVAAFGWLSTLRPTTKDDPRIARGTLKPTK